MVKTPRTRHSKSTREPMAIDLAPGEVARVKAEQEEADAESTEAMAADGPVAEPAVSGPVLQHRAEDQAFPGPGEAPEAPTADTDVNAAPAEDVTPDAYSAPVSAPPPKVVARGGKISALLAGAVGGALALVLAAGLQIAGLLPGGGSDGPGIAAVEARLHELEDRVAALGDTQGDNELAGRVDEAEQRLGSLAQELTALHQQVSDLQVAGAATDIAPIEERITAIETAIAGLGGASTPEAALAALGEQMDALRSELSSQQEVQAQAAARLDEFEQTLSDLTARLEEQAEVPGTAAIIAASSLKAAIDRGVPFATELDTFASLVPDAPEIEELRPMAETGVPTRAQIAAESDAAANAMIAAARPGDPEAGVFNRLWSSAMGLVQVRPIGMVEGEGVPETVARIDAAVTSNDYGRAIDEYSTLPDTAKAAGEGFMSKVRTRHAADALIDQALAAALRA